MHARTVQGPVNPLARVQRRMAAASARNSRPSGKAPRKARRLRGSDARSRVRTDLSPLVMDPQIRSVILWPRDYR
jgi:hypothetical protein